MTSKKRKSVNSGDMTNDGDSSEGDRSTKFSAPDIVMKDDEKEIVRN